MTGTLWSRKNVATVVLPLAIPPVRPMTCKTCSGEAWESNDQDKGPPTGRANGWGNGDGRRTRGDARLPDAEPPVVSGKRQRYRQSAGHVPGCRRQDERGDPGLRR